MVFTCVVFAPWLRGFLRLSPPGRARDDCTPLACLSDRPHAYCPSPPPLPQDRDDPRVFMGRAWTVVGRGGLPSGILDPPPCFGIARPCQRTSISRMPSTSAHNTLYHAPTATTHVTRGTGVTRAPQLGLAFLSADPPPTPIPLDTSPHPRARELPALPY